MFCIKLQLFIDATKEDVFNKLTSIEGLRHWWTMQTTGNAEFYSFRLHLKILQYHIQMKVINIVNNKLVQWQCTKADEDWIGTIVSFKLDTENGKTLVRFTHDKWPTHGDFFAHCNLSWAKYMLSLRLLLETGKGQPSNQ